MSYNDKIGDPELLVITDDHSFGDAIVDTIAELSVAASAERVEPPAEGVTKESSNTVAGIIVDSKIPDAVSVVERLTAVVQLPVVALTSASESRVVDRIVRAGATDIFSRTTANAQYELLTSSRA